MVELSVVGLGFVGIPLTVAFDSEECDVIGYDIDDDRVRELRQNRDPTGEATQEDLRHGDVEFTTDPERISGSDYVIITVPTPVDDWKQPDFGAIQSAGRMVGKHLSRGTTVILESTVYPGATREVLVPALEDGSGLQAGRNFSVGYSPERLAPGQTELREMNKIVSAQDEETLAELVALYERIIEKTVYPASTMAAAEAAKCLENAQRDVNIGLVNEFVMGCQQMDIDIDPWEALEAAGTKSVFHDYRPGLVGGHCIPVDPYFLVSRFGRDGYTPTVIEQARRTNEEFPKYLAESVVKNIADRQANGSATLSRSDPGKSHTELTNGSTPRKIGDKPRQRTNGKTVQNSENGGSPSVADEGAINETVLVLGFAYKPNVKDTRNEALKRMIEEFRSFGVSVCGHDPLVPNERLEEEFGVRAMVNPQLSEYDAIVLTTLHEEFKEYELSELISDDSLPYVLDLSGHFDQPDPPVLEQTNVS